jgi:hypothetical protein
VRHAIKIKHIETSLIKTRNATRTDVRTPLIA